jgi:hypothetical protein
MFFAHTYSPTSCFRKIDTSGQREFQQPVELRRYVTLKSQIYRSHASIPGSLASIILSNPIAMFYVTHYLENFDIRMPLSAGE